MKTKTQHVALRCLNVTLLTLLVLLGANFDLAASQQRRAPRRAAQVGAKTYINPVVAGDYPDPSVIRVGRDYYATATSSEWAPQFPILHSRDLVNWQVIGAVFQQRPAWSVGNYWAPEIAEDKGRYYNYYTARRKPQGAEKEGPLCVAVATAARPAGPYTDRGALVCQDAGSIDGFPIRDENGKRFLVWKEDGNSRNLPTPLWAQELTEDGTKLIGQKQELMRNTEAWEAQLIEGPAIVRRNGYFYMFYAGNACCGLGCNYATGIARSKTLLGNWEKYDANPILKGNDEWKCPGHGTLVSTPDGRDFLMYHAYHPRDFVYVGRQALLDEVTWTSDGWAQINNNQGASGQSVSPLRTVERNDEYTFFDDFNSPALLPGWQWLQNNEPTIRIARGSLMLSPSTQAKNPNDMLAAAVGYWTTTGDYTATTIVNTRRLNAGANAGITAFGDAENALGLVVERDGKLTLFKREKNQNTMLPTNQPRIRQVSPLVHLRMTATGGNTFQFAASVDGRRFTDIGTSVDGKFLPPWDRGVRVALTAGGNRNATGAFGSLRIEPSANSSAMRAVAGR
ncbi:MAG: family 43 glycosylhydrolase [Pyrinomonadaceae bacterium MAG19_C2-C3]|nr:family 43 glycosylhydrolase [Pyrinomonadaceae bacterium MAG19_C2-C3]